MGSANNMGRKGKTGHKIIALACILAVLTAGCGAAGGEEDTGQDMGISPVGLDSPGTEEAREDREDQDGGEGRFSPNDKSRDRGSITWQSASFQLEKPYTQILAADGILYGCMTDNGQMLLDIIGKDSLALEKTVPLPGIDPYSGIAADREGYVYYLETGEGGAALCRIDPGGEASDPQRIELKDSQGVEDMRLKAVLADERGYVYVWCGLYIPGTEQMDGVGAEVWREADRVYVMNREWKTCFYEEILDVSGVQVLCFQIGPEGAPFFLLKDQTEICIQEIDVDSQQAKERVSLGSAFDCFDMEDANFPEHMAYTGSGWAYCKNGALLEFWQDTQEKTQILNLASAGLLSEDILFLAKSEDRIEIIYRDTEALGYIVFTPGVSDKETVTLGVAFSAQDLERAVAAFNRDSAGYRVEIVDYFSRTGDYEEAGEQLKLDVATGKGPDVIAVSGIDYQMFAGKGVLADLYGFLEEDGECSKDMLVESVARAYENQGHLYSIAPAFQLHTIWGYGDVTGGQSCATFQELLQALQDSGKGLDAIGGFSADEPVLTSLCAVAMDEFVDWEAGTCAFDGECFREVLSFAGAYSPGYTESSYSERIRSREQVATVGILSSVGEYQIQKELYGGDLSVIGYPVAGGGKAVVDYRASAVAINAGKEDQAGAWAFVKFYLLRGYDGQGFPVVKDQFDQNMEAAMEDEYTAAEDGGGTEKLPKEYYGDADRQVFAYAATREEVDAVRKLVEEAENRFEYHPAIQNIINEEAQGYLSGQVDLDRTVEKIQNRASLLLQEAQ